MSKRIARQRKKARVGKVIEDRQRRKLFLSAGFVLCLMLAFGIAAQWRSWPLLNRSAAPSSPQSGSPAKEYVYAGGRLIATAESASLPAPTALVADTISGAQINITWAAPSGAVDHYVVERSQSSSGPYTALTPNPTTNSFTDTTVSSGTAYLYRVRAVNASGGSSPYSNRDLATAITFTDDPLVAGTTVIKAQHLVELRQAVNAVRALTGLSPATWTYPAPVSSPAEQQRPIYLEDVTDLRTNLDGALNILGLYQLYPSNPTLARGAVVRREHFNQIRDRVR